MALEMKLSDQTEKEFKLYLKGLIIDELNEIRKEEQLRQPYLNKSDMCEWLGISRNTLNKMIRAGLKVSVVDGVKLIGKLTVLEFLKEHEMYML